VNPAQHILVALVRVYRWTLSPVLMLLFGPQSGCRHTPTCSQYAAEAVRVHGALTGSWLATKRICRCNPWGGCGHDPVPQSSSSLNISGISNFKTHGS
jgi:putative membrane protein insertion efficiency factor